jgi:hypothetical protein
VAKADGWFPKVGNDQTVGTLADRALALAAMERRAYFPPLGATFQAFLQYCRAKRMPIAGHVNEDNPP